MKGDPTIKFSNYLRFRQTLVNASGSQTVTAGSNYFSNIINEV